MQSRQKSIFSFFHSSSNEKKTTTTTIAPPPPPPPHVAEKLPNYDSSLYQKREVQYRPGGFESLKSKLFRPNSVKNIRSNAMPGEVSDGRLFGQGTSSSNEETEKDRQKYGIPFKEERLHSCGPSHALDSSIPGIKRIREDHENYVSDESHILKRKRLMEALGEGEEQKGLWEEAKAKFQWLCPSKIRDSKGRKPEDPLYDKRTLQIPPDLLCTMSASQKQYWTTKCQYMDTILFFKVGKFYELYEVDAEVGHKELNWKMTVSGVGKCRQVGVPESGIEDAVSKLLARGYKVGRMEQVETSEQAKAKRGPGAMVQRELMHVLTPSTVMDDNMKPEAVHLLALHEEMTSAERGTMANQNMKKTIFGFAFVDAAAGCFYVGSLEDDSARSALCSLLTQVAPQELLYELGGLADDTMKALRRYSTQGCQPLELTGLQPNIEYLESSAVIRMIESHQYFSDDTDNGSSQNGNWLEILKSFNYYKPVTSALGALVLHLVRLKLDGTLLKKARLASYEVYKGSLRLDGQTLANLEIFQNNADGGKIGTLFAFLDNCSTPFGKRLLRKWICHPLQSIGEINGRLDAVEEFRRHPELVGMLRGGLQKLPDLERLISMICNFTCSSDVASIPFLSIRVQRRKIRAFSLAVKGLDCALTLLRSIRKGDNEGSVGSHLLLAISDVEGMNEANKSLVAMVSYVEKNFLNTKMQLLKQDRVLDDKESEVLDELLLEFTEHYRSWLEVVRNLSQIDVLLSFTVTVDGANGPMCRPSFVPTSANPKAGAIIDVQELWHPFASGTHGNAVVRNNIGLGSESNSCRAMLLTGPNMGGKSTLLRATCMVVILAQIGCYVPAESCVLSPVDIIFTRLGASDRIMSGESTFMVECTEAASVLRYATPNSLVILDELGRGTSTFDGYAIAFAVFRHLVDAIDCRLLFATHYHPLTKEFAAHPSVCLYHMAFAFESIVNPRDVSTSQKRLVFLYKLSPGASPDSYGLHVASLAGLPEKVIKQAENARSIIQSRLSSTFQANAHRLHFSHIHENWLRTIFAMLNPNVLKSNAVDIRDAYDTLLCVWHELQTIDKKKAA